LTGVAVFLLKIVPCALVAASLFATIAIAPAAQAQPLSSDQPDETAFDVPGGDIFGFTSPTDVGEMGDRGVALELSNRAGKRDGRYWAPTVKTQFSYTLADDFAIALSPFVTAHRIRNVPDLEDRTSTRFDGFSGEIAYRFIPRSETNPLAATFSMEPRIARVDALTGERVRSYGNEFKLFLDTVVVPGKLYAAVNLNYALGTQKGSDDTWVESSGTNLSGALTYQITDRIFAGVEGRWLTAFSGAFLNDQSGWGLFAGPTLLIKVTESAALNLVWTPQLAGSAAGRDGHLDLDNFERHQFRAKFATSF
jgi:hypothetical protein